MRAIGQTGEGIARRLDEQHLQVEHAAAHEHHAAGDVVGGQSDECNLPRRQAQRGTGRPRAGLHLLPSQVDGLRFTGRSGGAHLEGRVAAQPCLREVERGMCVIAESRRGHPGAGANFVGRVADAANLHPHGAHAASR